MWLIDLRMATGTKKRTVERDQDLFEFGRAYLSEAFPNPERKGCPPDETLRLLTSRPTQGDPSITDHVTCCSPCFNAYMAHLARARAELLQPQRIRRASRIRRSLVAAGIVVMVTVAAYLFVLRRHSEPIVAPRTPGRIGQPVTPPQVPATAIYVPVLVDLSNASPLRGLGHSKPAPSLQVIPLSPLIDFTLQLPLASEARKYSVMLRSNRQVVWSDSAQAHLENGRTLLHMHADFAQVRVGNYDLVVESKGFRLSVPVVVEITSSGRIQ
jgi:hypothetical protein